MSELGSTLRMLREKRGMTLAELAGEAGTFVGNLSRIERDLSKPSLDLLYRIAKALGFSLAEIFSVSESQVADERQVALNATFIALLDSDRELLLEFAKLLQKQSSQRPEEIAVRSQVMPAETKADTTSSEDENGS